MSNENNGDVIVQDGQAVLQTEQIGEQRYKHFRGRIAAKANAILSLLNESLPEGFEAVVYDEDGDIDDYDNEWIEPTVESLADIEKETIELLATVRRFAFNMAFVRKEALDHKERAKQEEAMEPVAAGAVA